MKPASVSKREVKGTDERVLSNDIQSGALSTFGGAVTHSGVITAATNLVQTDGDMTVADDLRITPQTAISLTMNGWLTPTGSLTLLESAGAVSIDGGAKIAEGTAGDLLILLNVGGSTIQTAADSVLELLGTGAMTLAGNFTVDSTNATPVIAAAGSTITISETTGLVSAGNVALGTLDSATFVYRGTSWYQIAASNN